MCRASNIAVIWLTTILAVMAITACDTMVITGDKLIYEDGSPATDIPMVIKGEDFISKTRTNSNGDFNFTSLPNIDVLLCAYHPEFGKCCFDGHVETPLKDGELITID